MRCPHLDHVDNVQEHATQQLPKQLAMRTLAPQILSITQMQRSGNQLELESKYRAPIQFPIVIMTTRRTHEKISGRQHRLVRVESALKSMSSSNRLKEI